MKKIINNPITYVILIYVLFAAISILIGDSVVNTILITLAAIVFYCLGHIGKENRDFLAKSIPGGGYKRPPEKDEDEKDTNVH